MLVGHAGVWEEDRRLVLLWGLKCRNTKSEN